ncbi:protein PAM71-, chloroplastic [Sesamum angolense]|uniref:GDT1 family protein n=1 Tax=Sesamum angolense TaxID=2727404 RepID=A0AAE2BRX2_9LAMI|nr:protein PAM71-, chloroplastic [Sesamum angolense]
MIQSGPLQYYMVGCRVTSKVDLGRRTIRAHALNVGTGSGGYEEREEHSNQSFSLDGQHNDASSKIASEPPPARIPYPVSISLVLCACALVFLLVVFTKGPSSLLPALAKSGFTAAFSLIFVSEIGDKTLIALDYSTCEYTYIRVQMLAYFLHCCTLGHAIQESAGASGFDGCTFAYDYLVCLIGLIFHSVPSQFQTTLPIGEYAAVTLLMFFGLKSIKDAWDIPSTVAKTGEQGNQESDEFVEAEELVKEKVSKRLSNPLEVLWKSFSLVFFAEWGDRSMLATIALGAAQSPWGVASGAIVGHLLATSIAILGGAFLSKYISEKLVGYIGGALFLVFAIATFFGVF